MKLLLLFGLTAISFLAQSQNYTSYFTGNSTDAETIPQGGVCMMGGATEHDEAMKWFLQRANGGDILVLRASGSDGYNNYMYSQLGVTVNSVETIVFNNATANTDPYVLDRISKAEAIWMAGGDQWNYVSYWRNTAVDSLINHGLESRNTVIGGTSAGMAVLGGVYFSAENGTVTSAAAMANPYNIDMTVDTTDFLHVDFMGDVITDTHYDDPDRKGRHVAFLARTLADHGINAKGIACDEYTAVCIDENGTARVYGDFPSYDDNAYFLQANCEIWNNVPETCTAGTALTWHQGGEAVKVYAVKGTNLGTNSFNVNTWQSGSGGDWENWFVSNGSLGENPGSAINCSTVSVSNTLNPAVSVTPTLVSGPITFSGLSSLATVRVYNSEGRLILIDQLPQTATTLDFSHLTTGIYLLRIESDSRTYLRKIVKQ